MSVDIGPYLSLKVNKMYKYTRQDVADILGISTRSVDRYIRSGKLRSKKEGKIIYIHSADIDSIKGSPSNQEIITPQKVESAVKSAPLTSHDEKELSTDTHQTLQSIYTDLKTQIQKKDELIQGLSMRLGQAEEIAKNSISLVEFKKSQFLLEESKGHLSNEVEILRKDKVKMQRDLMHEKSSNNIMIVFLVALLIITTIIWFIKI